MHFTTCHALLFAAAPFALAVGCIADNEHMIGDRQTKDAQTQTPASDAAATAERLKPPESKAGIAEPISLPSWEWDAQITEPPLRSTSLFTDAETPSQWAVDDDASILLPAFAPEDTATIPVLHDDASVSAGGVDRRVDSGPPRIPAPTQPGELVITEIMANPKTVSDSQGEWFELYNPSETATFNLRDCEIADDSATKCTIASDFVVAPRSFATIARSTNPGFTPSHVCSNLSLTNSDPDQVIVRCGAIVVDRVAYQKAKEATSLSLDPAQLDAQANDDSSAWCAATVNFNGEDLGTPGASNTACAK
jgi:hypothetical protein